MTCKGVDQGVVGFGVVDVRDLVDLHIRAMTTPAAANHRFIASGDFLWFADIARIPAGQSRRGRGQGAH